VASGGKPSPMVLADGKLYERISMEIHETSGNNSLRLSVLYDLFAREGWNKQS